MPAKIIESIISKTTKTPEEAEQLKSSLRSIRDWLSTMRSLKDSNSKAQRLRALDGFMKELYASGVRERFPLDNWDVIKTFSVCPDPIDVTSVPTDSQLEFRKASTRLYEIVDILHTNRTNLQYTADIPPNIRIRMRSEER